MKNLLKVGSAFAVTFFLAQSSLAADGCKRWCENVPPPVWSHTPGCEECSVESTNIPEWCKWVPEAQREKVPQCNESNF